MTNAQTFVPLLMRHTPLLAVSPPGQAGAVSVDQEEPSNSWNEKVEAALTPKNLMSVSEILMASQSVREAPGLLTIVAYAVHEEQPHFVHLTCFLPPERSSSVLHTF